MQSFASARRSAIRIARSTSLALPILSVLLCSPTLAQKAAGPNGPQRIRFTIGAISAQVNGRFTRRDQRVRYVIKAMAGDHMIVNVIPVTKGLTMAGTVGSPSGEGDGGPGGIIMNANLTEGGDYQIEVFQHTMGSNYSAGVFILEVVITQGETAAPNATSSLQSDVMAALTKARDEPTNFEAQMSAAELYYRIERYDESISYLQKANQLRPNDPETLGNLGLVNMDAGHYETAETWYKAALLKRPDDIRMLDGYCNVLLQLGKAKAAEAAIGELARLDPANQDLKAFRERLATLKSAVKEK